MLPPQNLWDDEQGLVAYYVRQPIPLRPQAGILVLSIIVSVLGSYATLLLLGRRTSSRGWRNHLFLGLAAVCFECVAVWGMHFVSVISIRLAASPNVTWYLQFSRGMTSLSLLVPLVVVMLAFALLGDEDLVPDAEQGWSDWFSLDALLGAWRIWVSGIFVGLTIGLMHYSASFQLPYLRVSYTASRYICLTSDNVDIEQAVTVVFALVLACIASTVALAVFFRARQQWSESFIKRGLASFVLAAAVCGMHYLALGGTSYMTKDANVSPDSLQSGAQSLRLTIAISVMCGAIIVLALALALIDYRTKARLRDKSRHVVLASCAFDETGKIMVMPDGSIPMQVIEIDEKAKNLNWYLDPRRTSYQWLYQLSFCWAAAVRPVVPRIVQMLNSGASKKAAPPRGLAILRERKSTAHFDSASDAFFRQRFIEGVVQLAHNLDLSVDSMGTLFDRVLQTGTKVPEAEPLELGEKSIGGKSIRDEESSVHGISLNLGTNSEGIMVFLVRELGRAKPKSVDFPHGEQSKDTPDTVEHYTAKGWRPADTKYYSHSLADSLHVSRTEMEVFMQAAKTYAKRGTQPVVQEGGFYLGLFGVRPTGANDGGLDVLVYNFARHQIPAYRLPDVQLPLDNRCSNFLLSCGGQTMRDIHERINQVLMSAETHSQRSGVSGTSRLWEDTYYDFLAALAVSMESLLKAMSTWPDLIDLAILNPDILELPCSDFDDKKPAAMIVLQAILPATHAPGPQAPVSLLSSPRASMAAQGGFSAAQDNAPLPGAGARRRDYDKPPSPFIYCPWMIFARQQYMIMRGQTYRDVAGGYAAELAKMWPVGVNDIAVELASSGQDQAGVPLSAVGGRRHSEFGTAVSESGSVANRSQKQPLRVTRAGTITSMRSHLQSVEDGDEEYDGESQAGSEEIVQLEPIHSLDIPPDAMDAEHAAYNEQKSETITDPHNANKVLRDALNSFGIRTKEQQQQQGGTDGNVPKLPPGAKGPPIYSQVRNRSDGWHVRAMRQLERTELGYQLDGTDWVSQAQLLPL